MPFEPNLERLVEALSRAFDSLIKTLKIRSASARLMFGCECLLATVLLIALVVTAGHDIVLAAYGAYTGREVKFGFGYGLALLALIMAVSFAVLIIREGRWPPRGRGKRI